MVKYLVGAITIAGIVLAIVCLCAGSSEANLLANPSFEIIGGDEGGVFWAAGWTRELPDWDLWTITDGSWSTPTSEDKRDGRIVALCNPGSSPSWVWNNTVIPAGTYTIGLWNKWYTHLGASCNLRLELGDWSVDLPLNPDGVWRYNSWVVTTNGGLLRLGGIGTAGDAMVIDMVSVEPVPEPGTAAVLLCLCTMSGIWARRSGGK